MEGILSVKKLRQPLLGLPQFFYVHGTRTCLFGFYIAQTLDTSPIPPQTGEAANIPPIIYIYGRYYGVNLSITCQFHILRQLFVASFDTKKRLIQPFFDMCHV